MFKKKPNIKNLSPIRSSERRKIVDQIIKDYGVEVPAQESEEGGEHNSLSALRNSLLPEGSLSAKFSTIIGSDSTPLSGTVFAGSFPEDEQRILWIRVDERLYPTVHTLWRHPKLVPLIHTPDLVLDKLRTGADLMTPGLARGPPFPAKAKKGSVVAIAGLKSPSVPVVLGECLIDVSELQAVQGAKGNAIKGVHWEGDEIFAWRLPGKPLPAIPASIDGWDDNEKGLAQGVQDMNLNGQADDKAPAEAGDAEEESLAETVPREKPQRTTKDIDNAFWQAFLYAAYEARKQHPDSSTHGVNFPIPQSQFISNWILPFLPIFDEEDKETLQLKKTTWKNVKKFIKALDKAVLVKSKERNGGEMVVLDIDFNDAAIQNFSPYRLPKKTSTTTSTSTEQASSDESVGQTIRILQLFKPKEKLAPLFGPAKADPRAYYLPSELRPIVTEYLKAEDLVTDGGKKVTLNPLLANDVFGSTQKPDPEINARGFTTHDQLLKRIQETGAAAFYAISRNDEPRAQLKPKAGAPPKIKLLMETRSGNKTATRVSGLEPFGIAAEALAAELQKACAGATSVQPLVGASPKMRAMEVMVQGPQRDAVVAALGRRGVKKEWVEVTDKTKGKKGGR